jgi:hypothetical protein
MKLIVYMLRKKKIVIWGNFHVEQIINMLSRMGNQRGGDGVGAFDFH